MDLGHHLVSPVLEAQPLISIIPIQWASKLILKTPNDGCSTSPLDNLFGPIISTSFTASLLPVCHR